MPRNLCWTIIEARVKSGDIGGHILWHSDTEEPLLKRVRSDFFIPNRNTGMGRDAAQSSPPKFSGPAISTCWP
jgi:hypothetical protein